MNNIDIEYIKVSNVLMDKTVNNNEKIKIVEDLMLKILNSKGTGKKVYKTIYGKKVYIPKKYIGKYNILCKELNKLKQNVNNYKQLNSVEFKMFENIQSEENKIMQNKILYDQYKKLKVNLNSDYLTLEEKNKYIKKFVDDNIVTLNFLKIELSQKNKYKDKPSDLTIHDLVGYENINVVKGTEQKQKRKRKNFLLKRVSAFFAAAFMFVCGQSFIKTSDTKTTNDNINSTSIVEMENDMKKNTLKDISSKKKDVYSETSFNCVEQEIKINKTITINKPSDDFNIKNKINLDDKFKVKKDSLIYSNIYNAIEEKNGATTYYSSDTLRCSVGIGIKYNNSVISFIKSTQDENTYVVKGLGEVLYLTKKEANKQINNLINKGGKIESIVSHNTKSSSNGIEGYFAIDDVKVLVK